MPGASRPPRERGRPDGRDLRGLRGFDLRVDLVPYTGARGTCLWLAGNVRQGRGAVRPRPCGIVDVTPYTASSTTACPIGVNS
jgi:hypothetical protein